MYKDQLTKEGVRRKVQAAIREYDEILISAKKRKCTVELQLLEQLWNHENMLETGVVRASEC